MAHSLLIFQALIAAVLLCLTMSYLFCFLIVNFFDGSGSPIFMGLFSIMFIFCIGLG